LPFEYSKLEPSSHNLNLVRQLDRWFGHQTDVSDRWLFRVIGHDYPEQVNISIVGNDFEFADLGTRTYRWNTLDEAGVLNLVVHSQTASQPFQLQLELYEQSVALTPSDRVWQTWQPSGLPGIEYMWIGSSRLPLNAMGLG
jgi:hypothetical protein